MSADEIRDDLGEELGEGIPDGTHRCTTTAKLIKSKKRSRKVPYLNGDERNAVYFVITYVISDPDSDLFGADDLKDYFELFPDIKKDDLADLDPEERKAVRAQISNRVRRFRQLGVPEEKLFSYTEADLSDLDVYVTSETTTSRTDGVTKFLNIRGVERVSEVEDSTLAL